MENNMPKRDNRIRCSFCNKTENQVRKLVAGPAGVYICDECIDVCVDILDEDTGDEFSTKPDISFDKLKLQYGVAHPSRFIRKDAYSKYGMYLEEMRYNMDIDLLCRFYKKGATFIHIDQDLTKFRMGGATADSIFKKKNDYKLFVKNYGGSRWDFQIIWLWAIIKYIIILISTKLFGEGFRFQYYKVRKIINEYAEG